MRDNRLGVGGCGGDFVLSFLQPSPPRFGERIGQIPLKSFGPHLKTGAETSSELSRRLRVERCWVDYFLLGAEHRLDSPRENAEISPTFPLSSPTTRRPSSRLPSFTTHGHRSPPRSFTRPLSPPPCPSLRARFVFYLLISLVIGLVSLSRRFHLVVLRL